MAAAQKSASITPVELRGILILAEDTLFANTMKDLLAQSRPQAKVLCSASLDEADEQLSEYTVQAVLTDHALSAEEKILARAKKLPLVLIGPQNPRTHSYGGFCGFLDPNDATPATLAMTIEHAIEKHALLHSLEEIHSWSPEYEEALVSADRLGAIISMIGVAAHELNQPLTSLLGHIELVSMNKDDPEKLMRYMERIDESGDKIARMVKNIQELRHEYWVSDSAFENQTKAIHVVYSGADTHKFDHLAKVLAPYELVELTLAPNNPDDLPRDYDLMLVEFAADDAWEKRLGGIPNPEKPVILYTERGHEWHAIQAIQGKEASIMLPAFANGRETIRTLASACELQYFSEKSSETIERKQSYSIKDDLTYLITEKLQVSFIDKEIGRAETHDRTSCFGIIDLLNAGQILETYGNKALDATISHMGRLLKQQAYREDIPARHGFDRFSVLLPGRDKNHAIEWFEGMKNALESTPLQWFGRTLDVGMCMGVASHVGGSSDMAQQWLERTEKAAQEARKKGPGSLVLA